MKINFDMLGGDNSADTVVNPREIFSVLPKKDPIYNYPRDVQTEVWNKWFEVRGNEYNVIKMNTGSGKTVVGLLILKSCLNEGKGPAVYVVPDPYLVSQVFEEAKKLGIEVTDDQESIRFKKGQAILVINVYKLFNGKSSFGVLENKIPIGSIIIDDAHACLDITESQFTMEIPYSTDVYTKLFTTFKGALAEQSDTGILELEAQSPTVNMLVPFWSWQDNIRDVTGILYEAYRIEEENFRKGTADKDYDSLRFSWQLLKNCLSQCSCIFGSDKIEISPKCVPILSIPSFVDCKRKIFMSATLADDSILVSHFNINADKIKFAITPESSDDIGDRMILIPQELNPDIKDEDIKDFLKEESKKHNVVVIVPSHYRSNFWKDSCDLVLTTSNLQEGITKLKNGHVGLVVMVNKYDGIDLAKEACEILVIDGLPDVRRKIDKIEQGILFGTDDSLSKVIQRIEQGMGRGIRSKDDYCVVFLMGRTLINHLYVDGAMDKFTPATKAQIKLSDQLAEQVRGASIGDLKDVINYSLLRNTSWISKSKGVLVHLKYDASFKVNQVIKKQREAFNAALIRDYHKSVQLINETVNETSELKTRGYLKQQLAEYLYFIDQQESHVTLKSAVNDNHLVLHPLEGIQYAKLQRFIGSQAVQASDFFMQKYNNNSNKFILGVNKLLEQLIFKPDSAPVFEEACKELAFYLGFSAQRPEAEYKKGPDVLWEVGNLEYLVIECKNGATAPTINKHDCNQLNGSIVWFEEKYDSSCRFTPVMIHPYTVFEYASSPNRYIRIINTEKLDLLKSRVHGFAKALAAHGSFGDTKKIDELLNTYSLKASTFVQEYTVGFTVR
ncbi:DEAD/DEAH box helicase family protein [Alicyclobacillus dauci]|uniref:DEAD/DEAH box helicase family protein n=1 Tax=Alicyclobacillus dauci TaxID=1475485 RepID=A0ABY6Z4N3_9BACL|nr:DEAD/DEAH box helicase family protein [Alicyclobacillus dauci]WAH37473.1 DEAD/DEAH box helicase family protein [Alicyclobacillus dauci]